MPSRTSLGIINNNRRKSDELTPYQRGKIENAYNINFTFTDIAKQIKYHKDIARLIFQLALKRLNSYIKKYLNRLNT